MLHMFLSAYMENCVCRRVFLSAKAEDWDCSSPDVQSSCTQKVIESHGPTTDLHGLL
jgi:hypothetical protein